MKVISPYRRHICEKKKQFRSRKKAWDDALFLFIMHGWYNTPYQCEVCMKYHLTSKYATIAPSKEFINGFNKWFGHDIL